MPKKQEIRKLSLGNRKIWPWNVNLNEQSQQRFSRKYSLYGFPLPATQEALHGHQQDGQHRNPDHDSLITKFRISEESRKTARPSIITNQIL